MHLCMPFFVSSSNTDRSISLYPSAWLTVTVSSLCSLTASNDLSNAFTVLVSFSLRTETVIGRYPESDSATGTVSVALGLSVSLWLSVLLLSKTDWPVKLILLDGNKQAPPSPALFTVLLPSCDVPLNLHNLPFLGMITQLLCKTRIEKLGNKIWMPILRPWEISFLEQCWHLVDNTEANLLGTACCLKLRKYQYFSE